MTLIFTYLRFDKKHNSLASIVVNELITFLTKTIVGYPIDSIRSIVYVWFVDDICIV